MYDFGSRRADVDSFTSRLCMTLDKIADGMSNIFESAVLPVRARAAAVKSSMLDSGALGAVMSGSGPAVFGIYSDLPTAEKAAAKLLETGVRAFICTPYYEK